MLKTNFITNIKVKQVNIKLFLQVSQKLKDTFDKASIVIQQNLP